MAPCLPLAWGCYMPVNIFSQAAYEDVAEVFPMLAAKKPVSPGYTFKEAAESPLAFGEPLVDGVMDVGQLAIFYGESGCMKSFVISDFAFHVANGWDWCGLQTYGKKRGVLIILGEGQSGYRKRIKALANYHGITDAAIYIVPEPVALDEDAGTLVIWIEEAEKALGIRVDLVVFDTFSLMMGAGEESSNRDVTRVVNNIRLALDGRSAACIHHTGHGDKTRERGAYQIRANADVRILVTRDDENKGKVITVSNAKQKDDGEFEAINLTYHVVEVGERNGRTMTSLVLQPTNLIPVTPAPPPIRVNKGLSVLRQAIEVIGSNEKEAVRTQFYALWPGDAEATRRAFNRAWNNYLSECTNG